MNLIISEEDIKKREDLLNKCLGTRNKPYNKKDIKRVLLLKRLKENIKNSKIGDIILKFNEYKDTIESEEEFIIFGFKESIFGFNDILINNGKGYIAGGLDGKAVLKEDWEQYKKEVLK